MVVTGTIGTPKIKRLIILTYKYKQDMILKIKVVGHDLMSTTSSPTKVSVYEPLINNKISLNFE